MRKITLLFATMLAMSGMAFGQKQGKLLWETTVDVTPYYPNFYAPYRKSILVSESGNTFINYVYSTKELNTTVKSKAVDKNGKIMWSSDDYYKNPKGIPWATKLGDEYATILCDLNGVTDSTFLFDKDFRFSRAFKGGVYYVEDGVLLTNLQNQDNSLIKYDEYGKELWRYKTDKNKLITPVNRYAPYVGFFKNDDNTNEFVMLDKDGKPINISEPFTLNPNIFIQNAGGSGYYAGSIEKGVTGVWVTNFSDYDKAELLRYNATAKKIGKVLIKDIISKDVYEGKKFSVESLNNNYLLITFIKNQEIFFSRIDSLGNFKTVSSNCVLAVDNYFNSSTVTKFFDDKDLMYAIQFPEKGTSIIRNSKIGIIRFDSPNLSWQKDIMNGASNFYGSTTNRITIQPDNTFLEISSAIDNSTLKSLKVYDTNGNLKWKSPFEINILRKKITDEYIYAYTTDENMPSNLTKIRYSDGKQLWSKLNFGISDFYRDINTEKDGSDFIAYEEYEDGSSLNQKISIINTDGTIKWTYTLDKNVRKDYTDFIHRNRMIIVSTVEPDGNLYKHVLRKFNPCDEIIATVTGKTEACPTEAVKLSTQKQDGVSYQWQKDGKDIPNFKDVAFDFGESGTYSVVVKDEVCQNTITSNAVKVNIRSLPATAIQAPKTTFCEGEKTTMTAATNGTFFQWQKDQKDLPNATSGIYEVSQAGDYRVGVRDDKCPQVGYSNIMTINLKPSPLSTISTDIKGVIYEPFTVKMSANTGTGLIYQWLKDDVIIPSETTANYEAKKSGKYNVSVSKDGCTKLSDALTISILIPLANQEEVGEEVVQIYPNPNKGEFKIILPKTLKSADIQLFDSYGRERMLTYKGEQAQAEGLVIGAYFLRVSKDGKTVTSKLIIE
jgi:hypothetical protein